MNPCVTCNLFQNYLILCVCVCSLESVSLTHIPQGHFTGASPGVWVSAWHGEMNLLTHWSQVKMATISQMTFSNAFSSWMKMYEFRWRFFLKFVPQVWTNSIPTLVQIMAWHRPRDKPLPEPMVVRLLMQICVTSPQWVKRWWHSNNKTKHKKAMNMIYRTYYLSHKHMKLARVVLSAHSSASSLIISPLLWSSQAWVAPP